MKQGDKKQKTNYVIKTQNRTTIINAMMAMPRVKIINAFGALGKVW